MSFGSAARSRAIVIGTTLTFAGLVLLAVAVRSGAETRTFVLAGLLSLGGVLRLMTAFSMDALRQRAHPVDPSDPRWHGGFGEVQLAGRSCAECERKITVAAEALACAVCAKPTHVECQELHRTSAHGPPPVGPFR